MNDVEEEFMPKAWVLYTRLVDRNNLMSEIEETEIWGVYGTLEEAKIALANGYVDFTEEISEGNIPVTYYIQDATLYSTFQNPVRSIASDEPKSKNESR